MGAPLMVVRGPHPAAGVRVGRVPGSTPYRVFYPAATAECGTPEGCFHEGLFTFLEGYAANVWPRLAHSPALRALARPLLWLASGVLPPTYMKVPNLYRDAPEAPLQGSCPLIIFSHGLKGTNAEHTLLFTSWALNGYVVVAVQHCDGSSNIVRRPEGDLLYYHPPMQPYDVEFRPRQIQQREAEFAALREFVFQTGSAFPDAVRRMLDPGKVVAAGFSYGAATAALAAVRHPTDYAACLLLDGWFHLDLTFLNLPSFDFPREVHAAETGLPVPSKFWISQEFIESPGISKATRNLVAKSLSADLALLPATCHMNFIDLPCWLPVWLTRGLHMLGPGEPFLTYRCLVLETLKFLQGTVGSPSTPPPSEAS